MLHVEKHSELDEGQTSMEDKRTKIIGRRNDEFTAEQWTNPDETHGKNS